VADQKLPDCEREIAPSATRARSPTNPGRFSKEIIGRSPALRAALKLVAIVAPTGATVMVQGETGTGKELIARAVHDLSSRREKPLVRVNCAAIPAGLLESELFGHERGAFTGAIARTIGRFELAHGGTLFLDEVGDFPLELQPKLLRVIQEKEFERVGSTESRRVNVRLVLATSRDLRQMVEERQFRSDLYYRINVFPIHVPPLRERAMDIPLLVRHFVNHFARQMNRKVEVVPAATMAKLEQHGWPGNIRELQNFIERAVILSPRRVLEPPLSELEPPGRPLHNDSPEAAFKGTTLEACEREHILRILHETRWIVGGPNGAATQLGLKRTTLIWKMQKLGIDRKAKLPDLRN